MITTIILMTLLSSQPEVAEVKKACVLPVCQKDAIISNYQGFEIRPVEAFTSSTFCYAELRQHKSGSKLHKQFKAYYSGFV